MKTYGIGYWFDSIWLVVRWSKIQNLNARDHYSQDFIYKEIYSRSCRCFACSIIFIFDQTGRVMVWVLKTGLTPPQGICACPKSGTVLVIDVSLFRYYLYFVWYTAVDLWIWMGLLIFRAVWGFRPGVHCTCWRPGFDLQMFKFIVFLVMVPLHQIPSNFSI